MSVKVTVKGVTFEFETISELQAAVPVLRDWLGESTGAYATVPPLPVDNANHISTDRKPQTRRSSKTKNQSLQSGREKARLAREALISKWQRQGLQIKLVEEKWARTNSGSWVILPFASESEKRPRNLWFGIPKSKVLQRQADGGVTLVALCERREGSDALDFVIPPAEVSRIMPKLSETRTGQLQFNIHEREGRYYLVEGQLEVTDLLHKTEFIR